MGAPALQDLHEALRLLAQQNRTIAQLNVDSDEIIGKLVERTGDVVRFVEEAGDTAVASAQRRDDLSTDFDLLDDALRELGPTMAELETSRSGPRRSWPTCAGPRPGLNTLATNLPAFARASERSLTTLGKAAKPGTQALQRGQDEIRALADAAGPAKPVAEQARLFLDDIADPRRAVQWDRRAGVDTGRTNDEPGQRDTMGYTGMEGLLNFFYILSLATNQYDVAGHTTHISLRSVEGPCGMFNAGENWPLDPGSPMTRPSMARRRIARSTPSARTRASGSWARTSRGSRRASTRRGTAGPSRSDATRAPSAPAARPTSTSVTPATRTPSSRTRRSPGLPPAAAAPPAPARATIRARRHRPGRSWGPERARPAAVPRGDPGQARRAPRPAGQDAREPRPRRQGRQGQRAATATAAVAAGGGLGGLGQGANQAAEDLLDFLFGPMRRRNPAAALAASPTMVGAVTTLIVIVAVFLAYNANKGLPFVPVYRVSVEVPNAARLGNNNEIRIGGTRVGIVESIEPVVNESAQQSAQTGSDGSETRHPARSARAST